MSIFKRRREESGEEQPITQEQAKALIELYTPLGGEAAALIVAREVTIEECPWLDEPMPSGTLVHRFTLSTYGCCYLEEGIPVSIRADEYPFFELPRDALAGEL